jgi:hypothetical protein
VVATVLGVLETPPHDTTGDEEAAHTLGRLSRPRPPRAVGPYRRAQRARGGVAADGGVQGGARGGEVLAANPAGAGGVRRVCYGERVHAAWRLDLGELRWERMSGLEVTRQGHACCAVRGDVVVLAGQSNEEGEGGVATVEVLRRDSKAEERTFADLPPLSCGPRSHFIALPIDESVSAEGEVLLLGGCGEGGRTIDVASRVLKVDLATGACTPYPPLRYGRWGFAAARLPDGRVVCAGGVHQAGITAEVLEPPEQRSPDGLRRRRELPHVSVQRFRAAGCVLSDGRFAVFGGMDGNYVGLVSCEVLSLDGDERWEPLPPMREARIAFTCAAVGGCVICRRRLLWFDSRGGGVRGSARAVEAASLPPLAQAWPELDGERADVSDDKTTST